MMFVGWAKAATGGRAHAPFAKQIVRVGTAASPPLPTLQSN